MSSLLSLPVAVAAGFLLYTYKHATEIRKKTEEKAAAGIAKSAFAPEDEPSFADIFSSSVGPLAEDSIAKRVLKFS